MRLLGRVSMTGQTGEPDGRLALQAYGALLELILGGEMKAGSIIQERRLALQLNMSRTPVRDALMMLESEGLLVRHEPRMLQVKQMDVAEYVDNIAIRKLLEPEAARLAAGRISPELLEQLRDEVRKLAQDGATAERSRIRAVDERLHGAIGAAAGNEQMSRMVQALRRRTQAFDLKSVPERLQDTCREHIAIIEALASGDDEAASRAMSAHLDNVRRSIIDRLKER